MLDLNIKESIKELSENEIQIRELTKDMLPKALANYLFDVAESSQLPKEYLVASALGFLAGLLGNRVRLEIANTYKITPVLWICLIGKSGSGKSPCLEIAKEPLKGILKNNIKHFLSEKKEYEIKKQIQMIKEKDLISQLRKNANNEECKNKVLRDIESIKKEEVILPYSRYFELTSGTKEAIYQGLEKDSPTGLLLLVDELSGLFSRLCKYNNTEEKAVYLSLYNGFIDINNKTVSRGNDIVENATLSIIGGIQLDKMKEIIARSDDSGLLARFQLPIVSLKKVKRSIPKDNVSIESYKEYENCFYNINSIPHCFNIINNGLEITDPINFKYSEEAYKEFAIWFESNQERIYHETNQLMIEFLSKANNTVCTLALIFHLINNHYIKKEIGIEEVKQAIGMTEFFVDNAKYLYAEELMSSMSLARECIESIDFLKKEQKRDGYISKRTFKRFNRRRMKDDKIISEVIDILEKHNYLILVDKKRALKHKHYTLNPDCFIG